MKRLGQDLRFSASIKNRRTKEPLRAITFGCSIEDANLLAINLPQIAITYFPSTSMEELLAEIKHLQPQLVVCDIDLFPKGSVAQICRRAETTDAMPSRFATADTKLRLSYREKSILSLLVEGKSNAQIANSLHLSTRTIRRTITGLLIRVGARNRTELATKSTEMSLLDTR